MTDHRVTNLTEGAAFARGGPVRRALHVVFPPPARRRIWLWVTRGGPVADLYFWLDPRTRSRRVTRKTDIVIDGMARSANSYAHVAFLLTNGESLNISHHLHTPRVIERGVRFGIPTIVLIRDPRAVLASVIQYDKDGSAEQFLDAYLSYYRTVEPLLDRVVLADFTEVIADFGGVIDRCNAQVRHELRALRAHGRGRGGHRGEDRRDHGHGRGAGRPGVEDTSPVGAASIGRRGAGRPRAGEPGGPRGGRASIRPRCAPGA